MSSPASFSLRERLLARMDEMLAMYGMYCMFTLYAGKLEQSSCRVGARITAEIHKKEDYTLTGSSALVWTLRDCAR